MKKTYICWYCKYGLLKRFPESEMIIRKEKKHKDLCCPKCEKVIVCKEYK